MTDYYNPPDDAEDSPDDDVTSANDPPLDTAPPLPGGGRRLGEGPTDPQPIPTVSSKPSSRTKKRAAPQKKIATLGDFGADAQDNEDPNDSDDDDEKQDMFAGGEKSGLAVKNPDDLKKKILDQARK